MHQACNADSYDWGSVFPKPDLVNNLFLNCPGSAGAISYKSPLFD